MTQALYMSFFQDYGVCLTLSSFHQKFQTCQTLQVTGRAFFFFFFVKARAKVFLNAALTAAWLTLLRHQIDRHNLCSQSFSKVWGILNVAVMFPVSSWCQLFPPSSSNDYFTGTTEYKMNTVLQMQVYIVGRILNLKDRRHSLSFFVSPLHPHHPNLPGHRFNVSLVNKQQRSLKPECCSQVVVCMYACVCVGVHALVCLRGRMQ